MARIVTDEELERECAKHVLVFAVQQQQTGVDSLTKALDDAQVLPSGNARTLLTTALGAGFAIGVASASHRYRRAGATKEEAQAVIDSVRRDRPYMRPLGPTAGVPDDTPPIETLPITREPEVVRMEDLPEPVPQPAKRIDDFLPVGPLR